MKAILIYLGLIKPTQQQQEFIIKISKSVYPENPLTEQEWMNTFRVSMLHDRHVLYF